MSDTDRWLWIAGLALVTFTIKGIGPFALGGRDLSEPARRVIAMLAAPILAALVVTAVLTAGPRWSVGAHTVGVALAGVLMWRFRLPLVWGVLLAAATTAAIRALGTLGALGGLGTLSG